MSEFCNITEDSSPSYEIFQQLTHIKTHISDNNRMKSTLSSILNSMEEEANSLLGNVTLDISDEDSDY